MNTQKEVNLTPPQMGQYQNPGPNQPENLANRNILHTSEEDILLQTCSHPYGLPLESTPNTSEEYPTTYGKPLMIPHPNIEPNPRIPRIPLQQNIHNPHTRVGHNYSLVVLSPNIGSLPLNWGILD
jgi:hypothetical protein